MYIDMHICIYIYIYKGRLNAASATCSGPAASRHALLHYSVHYRVD